MNKNPYQFYLRRLGIDTYKEPVVYMRSDCTVCRSEGFEAQARVQVMLGTKTIIATLNTVDTELLRHDEASLSNYAWDFLGAKDGSEISISHPEHTQFLSYIHSKVYGHELSKEATKCFIDDVVDGKLSDIHISAFLVACASNGLSKVEIINLTKSMVQAGKHLHWSADKVVDKHSIGGLPGNRTSLIIVPIVASFGLVIPKTSSRAITSPSGTADTMEVLAPVNLSIAKMKKVVEQENGCLIWGGAVSLSPADDLLIRVERVLELDSEGQLIASILSKKIAAGSTHILIDMPVGPTAKIRSAERANVLKNYLESVGSTLGVKVSVIFTDGFQPVGRGIGPALEAKDVLSVLQCDKDAPQDLRERSLMLAGSLLEFSPDVPVGTGRNLAQSILDSGKAFNKFHAICEAQGGFKQPPTSSCLRRIIAKKTGKVIGIDNRRIARIAKLAGAPKAKSAGVELLVTLNKQVDKGDVLFVVHAETRGELDYALSYFERDQGVIHMENDR